MADMLDEKTEQNGYIVKVILIIYFVSLWSENE